MLNNNLDIVSYVRNNLLFTLITEIILDEQKKSIINFLCRPILSINNDNNNSNFVDFYSGYKDSDFEKFYDDIIKIIQKPKKRITENKLIALSNKHLKTFCITNS